MAELGVRPAKVAMAPQPHSRPPPTARRDTDTPPEEPTSLAAIHREHILRVLQAAGWVIEGERGAARRGGSARVCTFE